MEGLVAIVMALGIPLVAIVGTFWAIIEKIRKKERIVNSIIREGIDPACAKELLGSMQTKRNPYTALRWGAVLVGLGLGAVAGRLMGLDVEDFYLWIMLAFGMGAGFLVSFIVEMRLAKRGQKPEENAPTREESVRQP
ncbi:MAG: hypothetical protein LUI09_00075 [Prevotellaceae bacterium]|nr:hypothetical protein [Prevotellaceae bacterium]